MGVFGLLLQAKENRKIMSIEIKTENELNEMKKGLVPSDEFMGNLIFFGEKELPYDGNYGFYYISQSLSTEEYFGKLETVDKNNKIYFYEDSYWSDKAKELRKDTLFVLLFLVTAGIMKTRLYFRVFLLLISLEN